MVDSAVKAAERLSIEGISLTVVNARFIKPLDRDLLLRLATETGRIFTAEENALQGGFGSAVLELLEEEGITGVELVRFGYPDSFVEQGEQHELRARYALDSDGMTERIRNIFSH
jgi:1-deoxy-D-xylulose-5-phosphate synthase